MATEKSPLVGDDEIEKTPEITPLNARSAKSARASPRRATGEPAVNAIQASRKPKRTRNAAGPGTGSEDAPAKPSAALPPTTSPVHQSDSDPWTVPQSVRDRFVQDGHRFYFPDGVAAFRDLGRKLTTASENTQVVRSLIEIAHSRGWTEVTVTGTERFRQEAWRQARLEGLAVRGYRPTDEQQAQLIRSLARKLGRSDDAVSADTPSPTVVPPPPARSRASDGSRESIAGKLLDHGRDSYRHNPNETPSYFARVQTKDGPREIWGQDIERAVSQSLTQPQIGDEVILQRTGRDAVTIKRESRDEQGNLATRDATAYRNRWVIEKQEFFAERARTAQVVRNEAINPQDAVRQRPELAGTYAALRAAALAARSLRDPENQAQFIARIRQSLADGIQSGEPLITVRVRERREVKSPPHRSLDGRESTREL